MKTQDYIDSIIVAEGFDMKGINNSLDLKKKLLKNLKKQLKEIEYMKRTGRITLIIEENTVITTYHVEPMKIK